jgi:hypothetical protein
MIKSQNLNSLQPLTCMQSKYVCSSRENKAYLVLCLSLGVEEQAESFPGNEKNP